MIRIIVVGFTILAGVWLLLRFMGSNAFGRGKSRADFAHGVRSLLLLMESGGVLRIRHRPSKIQFDFVRASGSDKDADLTLLVQRGELSQTSEDAVRKAFESHGFDGVFDPNSGEGALAEVHIHVSDIWDEGSGARGARAAHLLVDSLSIPRDAKFDLALLGPRSSRIARREREKRAAS